MCGVEIGAHAFVGAGALVIDNVRPYALVVGVPAMQIGWMSMYGEQLNLPVDGSGDEFCPHTDQQYFLVNGHLSLKRR